MTELVTPENIPKQATTQELGIKSLENDELKELTYEILRDWVGVDELYSYFGDTSDEAKLAKERFAQGEIAESDYLKTPLINQQLIQNRKQFSQALSIFTEELPHEGPFREISELKKADFEARTDLLELSLVQQTAMQEDNPKVAEIAARDFTLVSKEIYGEADPMIFSDSVALWRSKIEKADVSGIDDGELVRERLLSTLPITEKRESYRPSDEVINELQKLLESNYADLFSLIEDAEPENGESFSPEERRTIYQAALDMLESNGYKHSFSAEIRPVTAENVDQNGQVMVVAERRTKGQPTKKELKALFAHEFIAHLMTRVNAENSDAPIAALGMPGYVNFHEGQGVAFEQAMNGKYGERGINYYVVAGLAEGLLSEEPRNEQQVAEIVGDYFYLTLSKTKGDMFESRKRAKATTRRLFRGTTGLTPGAYYSKDLAYRSNIDAWQYFEKAHEESPEALRHAFESVMIGKYDPRNEEHKKLFEMLQSEPSTNRTELK